MRRLPSARPPAVPVWEVIWAFWQREKRRLPPRTEISWDAWDIRAARYTWPTRPWLRHRPSWAGSPGPMNYDGFVKNLFSLPWRGGIKGGGKIKVRNTATY